MFLSKLYKRDVSQARKWDMELWNHQIVNQNKDNLGLH